MRLTDLFIRRPVLAIVLSLMIVLAGVQAWHTINIRQYPRSENATVSIATVYVGASAELVRGFVTTPLERAVSSAEGIDYVQSKSLQGLSLVNARLKINYDPIKALAEINAKVNEVRNQLPAEAEVPAIQVQSADAQIAAAYLSFSSQILNQSEITDYIVRVVQPRLSALAGVQQAQILGARTFAMRVWLKPDRMAALGVSPSEVRAALAANNYLAPVGTTKGALTQVNLVANTDLHSADEFKQLVVHQRNGAIVRLKDVADVELGSEDYDTEVRYTGQTAVFIGIFPLPNANTIDVVARVRESLDGLRREMPKGLEASVAYDASEYINNAIHDVIHTLVETLLIVIVVIFLFLGSIRSALVPVIAIPVSLIGGVFLMQLFGFTLNLLTLLAIVLSVGLVVDDAIVVVENVERHLREGRTPFDAALIGARELIGPIIAMTITLAAVYTPIGLQGGLTGALFREFALTLAGAVTISGIVALTLSPMMASRMLRSAEEEERGFAGWLNRHFDRLRRSYGRALSATLRIRPVVYGVWIVLGLLSVPMFIQSPKELAPTEDQGVLFGAINTAANATADQKSYYGRMSEKVLLDVPERQFTFQILFSPSDPFSAAVGFDGFSGTVLKPWDQRKRTTAQILPEVQGKLSASPASRCSRRCRRRCPGATPSPSNS